MSLQVSQRRARAVRAAEEIESLVAKRCAYFIHVIRSDSGYIELQIRIRFELFAALADVVEREEITEICLQIRLVVKLAIEWMRAAGAALIDEEQVAMRKYLWKCLRDPGSVFGG